MGRAKKKQRQRAARDAGRPDTPTLHNRKARHEFELLECLQAGLVLSGTEARSLRLGRGKLEEGFVRIDKSNQAYLYGVNIPKYEFGNRNNHDPDRVRKLLLRKRELLKWRGRLEQEKLTIVPTKLYFLRSWAKVEICLAKRKLKQDKRKDIKERDVKREMEREIKRAGLYTT